MKRWLICILLVIVACASACGNDGDGKKSSDTKPPTTKAESPKVTVANSLADFCQDFQVARPLYKALRRDSAKDFANLRTIFRKVRYPADLSDDAARLDEGIVLVLTEVEGLDFETEGKKAIDGIIDTPPITAAIAAYFTIDSFGTGNCKAAT